MDEIDKNIIAQIDAEIELLKKKDNFNKRAFFAMLNSEMKNIYNKSKGVGNEY